MGKLVGLLFIISFLFAPMAVRADAACFDQFELEGDRLVREYSDAFETYISSRISTLSHAEQIEVRGILHRVRFQRNFKTAAYDQLGRSIVLNSKVTKDMLAHYDLLAHEIEHGIQVLGKNRVGIILGHVNRILMPGPAVSLHIVKTEREAIGAEWDFLNSLPKFVRDRGLSELRKKKLHPTLLLLLEEGLAKADLPRAQYIDECARTAKYTMQYQVFAEYGVKIAAYSVLALTGYQWTMDNEE